MLYTPSNCARVFASRLLRAAACSLVSSRVSSRAAPIAARRSCSATPKAARVRPSPAAISATVFASPSATLIRRLCSVSVRLAYRFSRSCRVDAFSAASAVACAPVRSRVSSLSTPIAPRSSCCEASICASVLSSPVAILVRRFASASLRASKVRPSLATSCAARFCSVALRLS